MPDLSQGTAPNLANRIPAAKIIQIFHADAALALTLDARRAEEQPAPDDAHWADWLKRHRDAKRQELFFYDEAGRQRFHAALASHFAEHFIAAGGVVENGTGSVLTIFRRGAWDLPKGKLDPGEAPEAAALREVAEETGVSALIRREALPQSFHIYEAKGRWFIKTTHWWRMALAPGGGAPELVAQADEDIERVEWTPSDQLLAPGRPTHASIRNLLTSYASKFLK